MADSDLVVIGGGVEDVGPKRGVQQCHRLASVLDSRPGGHPQEPKPGGVPGFVLGWDSGSTFGATLAPSQSTVMDSRGGIRDRRTAAWSSALRARQGPRRARLPVLRRH